MSSITETASAYEAPSRRRPALWLRWLIPLGVVAALLVLAAQSGWLAALAPGGRPADSATYVVQPASLDITLVEDGELEPREKVEIKCEVEGQSTILYIVDESVRVSRGDKLVELASEEIVDRIEQEKIEVENMESEYQAAVQELNIQLNQNASDIRSAELQLALAERELEKYVKGDFEKAFQGVEIKIEETNLKLERKREEAERNARLFERGFVEQSKIDQLDMEIKTLEMQLVQNELEKRILIEYDKPMTVKKKQEDIDQATEALERTRQRATAREMQARAKVTQFEQLLGVRRKRLERRREQLEKCLIVAPCDGVVQYPQDDGWRRDEPLTVGSTVREGQTLCVIPDTSQMVVATRIHEADRHRVDAGLRCFVKVPAVPGHTFTGRLAKVAKFADSTNSWLNPDLKEHATEILLDSTDAPLSPGDSAEIEIVINRLENVLAVPVQCVHSRGPDNYVFVHRGRSVEPVPVELGQSNVNLVEVRAGLANGDRVLLSADEALLAALPAPRETDSLAAAFADEAEDDAAEQRPAEREPRGRRGGARHVGN